MANNILSNNSYTFPTRDTALSYRDFPDYMDEVKNFFINKLGFYVYEDRESYEWTSNFNIYIDYYSDKENGDPFFCFRNARPVYTNHDSGSFYLEPCSYNDIKYHPLTMGYTTAAEIDRTAGAVLPCKGGSIDAIYFNFFSSYSMQNIDIIVKDIKFKDGNRAIFFRSQKKSDHQYFKYGHNAVLFYTDIVFQNQIIKDWVFLNLTINTSYNPFLQQHLTDKHIDKNKKENIYIPNITKLEDTGGLIPINQGKEYLIKQNFYIGNDAYIPNIYRFSNLIGSSSYKGMMGNVVTIKNKEYLILYNGYRFYNDDNTYNKKVLNYDQSDPASTDFNDSRFYIINTESLLIPL